MKAQEFLEVALPTDGAYCLVGIKDGVVKHRFTNGIADLLAYAERLNEQSYDCYFACASFKEEVRKQEHAFKLRSFYFDIDIGADKAAKNKGYETQADALVALKQFCQKLELPKPSIIDSGRGLHCYWLLDDDVEKAQWQPVADALKQAALDNHLLADPAVTADSARILRIPGTFNYKDEEPKPVRVLTMGKTVTVGQMWESVKAHEVRRAQMPVHRPKRELDPVTKALLGNYESNFAKIARRSLKDEGCAQIKHILVDKDDQPYDLWTAALTIAIHCNDGDKAIHKISEGHPDYDPRATVQKAEAGGFYGPRTCAWYRDKSGYGHICGECPHKITSPIQLGRVVLAGEEPTVTAVAVEESGPTVKSSATPVAPSGIATLPLPDMPFPFFRGKNGGIYRKNADPDADDVIVYEHDLFIVKRMVDPIHKDCVTFRLQLPHDPVREFTVPYRDTQAPDKFRDILSDYSVVTNKQTLQHLMAYTNAFVSHLLRKMKAEEARLQFGWADGNTKFILGTREISAAGEAYAPPSKSTSSLAPALAPEGDFALWKQAFNMYVGYEGADAQVFSLLSAFGAPLMKFTGTNGAMISLVNTVSGTGKTSTLRLINSVWGHPDKLMQNQNDTVLARVHRLGTMGCLPATFDEMTNETPEGLSDFVYTFSHQRGRNRMRSDANDERVNKTSWSTIGVSTGNSSMTAKLAANKATSDGELMRVMEFQIPLIDVEDAHEYMSLLPFNYGYAGGVYAKALVKNATKIPSLIEDMRKRLVAAMGASAKERFWVNTTAAILVGGAIAKRLDLHDYDIEGLFHWIVGKSVAARATNKSHIVSAENMLGEYLLDFNGQTLVMDSSKINPLNLSHIMKNANGKVAARFEVSNQSLYIPKKDLRDYCVRRQGDLDAILHSRNDSYTFVGSVKKRMMAGTGVNAPPVEAFEFRVNKDALEEMMAGVGA